MPTWQVRFDLNVDLDDHGLIRALTKAEVLASLVRGIPLPPHIYRRLDRLNIVRAVRGTTGIEGSDLSEEEVDRVLTSPNVLGSSRAREAQEVINAEKVMRFIERTLDQSPTTLLTEDLIKEVHALTTTGIDYEANVPGQYREHAVTAGTYVPPRADLVRHLMRDYVRWLNEGPVLAWPPVARAIGAHFYFISIHPFGDGNGRTARAIESFLLYQAKVNAVGFYSLSNFYYRRRPEYIEMLDFVRFQSGGNLTPFVTFAAGGLVEELETVRDELLAEVTLIAYRDFVRERFEHMPDRSTKVRDRMQEFVLGLSREPIGVKELLAGKSLLSLPYRTLSQKTMTRDIDVLEEEGLILRSGDYIRPNLEVMDQFKP